MLLITLNDKFDKETRDNLLIVHSGINNTYVVRKELCGVK